MKKLIKKFYIDLVNLCKEDADCVELHTPARQIAEECKKVAIDFNEYVFNLDTCKYTNEEMFSNFIEEEYGK